MIGEFNAAASWIVGNDTGVSSKVIWSVLAVGRRCRPDWLGTPLDDDDFGRCHRLLKLIPSWRERLPEVAKAFPEWAPLVEIWAELEALHEAGESGKVFDRINEVCPFEKRSLSGGRCPTP